MKSVLTAEEMLAADRSTIAGGVPSAVLTKRAATAVLKVLQSRFDLCGRVAVFCGPGHNGTDGLVLAGMLCEQGVSVRVIDIAGKISPDDLPQGAELQKEPDLTGCCAVVDAIFGIGLTRPAEGEYRRAIEVINRVALPTLAIDIPSGIYTDSGKIPTVAVRATETVAISNYKRGHFLFPAAEHCGRLTLADIGVSAPPSSCFLLEKENLHGLPPRPAYANKGTFGRVLTVAGSLGMSGAGYLAAKAAYRAGAGLVELFAPAENRTIYQCQLPEAVLSLYSADDPDPQQVERALKKADAIALGMGLSVSAAAETLLRLTLEKSSPELPLILDADGLNLIATHPELFEMIDARTCPAILTPHLGEMARLCGKPVAIIAANMEEIALDFAQKHRVILVLKDTRTLITDGKTVFYNAYGNSGMATGGSGDVLAGVIATFAAAGTPPFGAARLGVLAHALAGDVAAEKYGKRSLMASDLIEGLCTVLKDIP